MEVQVPAVELPRSGPMTVRIPETRAMRHWLYDGLGWRTKITSDPDQLGGLVLPRNKLDAVISLLLTRFDEVELFRQYQPGLRCTNRCRYATRLLCACPCSGEQHGSQAPELAVAADGAFELIGTGLDDWSFTRIVRH